MALQADNAVFPNPSELVDKRKKPSLRVVVAVNIFRELHFMSPSLRQLC